MSHLTSLDEISAVADQRKIVEVVQAEKKIRPAKFPDFVLTRQGVRIQVDDQAVASGYTGDGEGFELGPEAVQVAENFFESREVLWRLEHLIGMLGVEREANAVVGEDRPEQGAEARVVDDGIPVGAPPEKIVLGETPSKQTTVYYNMSKLRMEANCGSECLISLF